ncbi:MAG: TolC family protein [Verrucomicrobiales bacterium]|nr:TolC family protein [Verrucomicrobiales bacterium]
MPPTRIRALYTALIGAALAVALGACSARRYGAAADREVSRLITTRGERVPNMDRHFTIETNAPPDLGAFPRAEAPPEFLGNQGEMERDAVLLPLVPALTLAIHHSRDFQARKETLYLTALDVTLVRHRHQPNFFGNARADYQVTTEEVRVGIDAITGQPTTVLTADAILVEEQRVSGSASVGVNWLLATGARLGVAFTTDFLRYLTGDPRTFSQSQVAAQLTQPLLQGAGKLAAMEDLTQGERSLLYGLREFTQYRKEFAVDIASAYYGILQNRDAARNAWADLQRSRQNAEREKAFAEEGLRPMAAVDQLQQNVLTSETRWIETVRAYREALDRFKIRIGLPIGTRLVLDDRELAALAITEPGLSLDEALSVAVQTRLDLQSRKEQVEDAERRIKIAANRLLPKVDLVAAGSISGSANSGFATPDFERYRWNAGLDVDLPFDRKAERNGYRSALIARNRASREWDLAVDEIRLQIASDARELEQARRNYENAEVSVKLGDRRVEEQTLRAELGRGTTRDLLDAQADLLAARNQRTSALVSHNLARLRFWRDMGILYLKDNGHWDNLDASVRQVRPLSTAPTADPASPNATHVEPEITR